MNMTHFAHPNISTLTRCSMHAVYMHSHWQFPSSMRPPTNVPFHIDTYQSLHEQEVVNYFHKKTIEHPHYAHFSSVLLTSNRQNQPAMQTKSQRSVEEHVRERCALRADRDLQVQEKWRSQKKTWEELDWAAKYL